MGTSVGDIVITSSSTASGASVDSSEGMDSSGYDDGVNTGLAEGVLVGARDRV